LNVHVCTHLRNLSVLETESQRSSLLGLAEPTVTYFKVTLLYPFFLTHEAWREVRKEKKASVFFLTHET
jgi:hypothetical protein